MIVGFMSLKIFIQIFVLIAPITSYNLSESFSNPNIPPAAFEIIVFEGENLVAKGVEMEARSVEDQGESISFHVFVYNVQPNIEIDYATGESREEKADTRKESMEIRGNTRSKIYHCPGQAAYEEMADSKYLKIFHSEAEAKDAGYRKAKR